MLTLKPSTLVGAGLHRECYLHPENDNLCVKVLISAGGKIENKREFQFYNRLKKYTANYKILPHFHGTTMTNRGSGMVYELIRDFNGVISYSLEHYLHANRIPEHDILNLVAAIEKLKTSMLAGKIVTMNLHPKNILYRRNSEKNGNLVIIDNMGNSDLIPIASYSSFFAKQKILRKWRRFEEKLKSNYSQNQIVQQLFSKSH